CHQMDRKAHDALSPEHQQTKQATLALTTTRRVLTRPRPPRVWRPPGLLLHPTSVADRLGVVILADRHGADAGELRVGQPGLARPGIEPVLDLAQVPLGRCLLGDVEAR